MNYWLFKTEPGTFSWEDLKKSPEKTSHWEGVRNYQARNFIRSMKTGDMVFFYHSVIEPLAIFGICRVVKDPYPDHFQFDSDSKYYDPKSAMENPRWWMVDIQYVSEFNPPVTRNDLKEIPELSGMVLLQKGSRLSIQPVTSSEWNRITALRSK